MESSKRAQRLISQILELLRELSYETQRQDRVIAALEERLAALEQRVARQDPVEPESGTAAEP